MTRPRKLIRLGTGEPNEKTNPGGNRPVLTEVTIHLCIPDDQEKHLPSRRRAPHYIPNGVPLPRQGEVVYLSSSSAWGVTMVIHEWRAPDDLHIELWLEHVGSSRHARPDGFTLTQ
jgi:hypothetical protein